MWNFIVRGLFILDIRGIEDLFIEFMILCES